jgi:ribosomal peptide maturation radical SAM protein 1
LIKAGVKRPDPPSRQIALIAPPWPLYTRPSLQLGALKAFVRSQFPEVAVRADHVYLNIAESIGYELYHFISQRTWLAETVYGALLYPELSAGMARLFQREATGNRLLRRTDFARLVLQVQAASEHWLSATDWKPLRLVGVSSVLCQLTAGLYFIRSLKQLRPDLTIVAGGAAFNFQSGPAALALFPEIDALVCGEGELPLRHLVEHHVMRGQALQEMPACDGILLRGLPALHCNDRAFCQMESLKQLPVPDFTDYFNALSRFAPAKRFFPTLPVEFSRGCWWQCESVAGEVGGCEFCNLNLQWRGYRAKSAAQVVSEVDQLTRRHRVLSLAVMDNVLPKDSSADLLAGLSGLGRDLSIFAEIRATTPLDELKRMQPAGMHRVQVGIEALSTRLLRKLRKGTTAIQNLEIMKHCEALGITQLSNLIAHFPASDEEDVAETLIAMDFGGPFRPPQFVSFWLGLGSPAWRHPERFGLRRVFNHPNWARIFPERIFRQLPLMVQSYQGGRVRQRRLWQPVHDRLRSWARSYEDLHRGAATEPILGYRDAGDFMIIRERRLRGETASHRLEGSSRRIYLFCHHHRSLQRITQNFHHIPADRIASFLRTMTAQKLMFSENNRFLSLAVPIRIPA